GSVTRPDDRLNPNSAARGYFASLTQRKPVWLALLSAGFLSRALGRYRRQYWSSHRNDPPRRARRGWPPLERCGRCRPLRVVLRRPPVVIRVVVVLTPLPGIAAHVVEAVAVWRERLDWGQALEPVGAAVLLGELALIRVRVPLAAVALLRVAPAVRLAD